MKFETKFNIGDEVYRITNQQEQNFDVCPVCKGKKKVFISTELGQAATESKCPNCYGKGKVVNYIKGYHFELAKINKVSVKVTERGHKEIKYGLIRSNLTRTTSLEHLVFATESEAQKKCDYLNQKESEKKNARKH